MAQDESRPSGAERWPESFPLVVSESEARGATWGAASGLLLAGVGLLFVLPWKEDFAEAVLMVFGAASPPFLLPLGLHIASRGRFGRRTLWKLGSRTAVGEVLSLTLLGMLASVSRLHEGNLLYVAFGLACFMGAWITIMFSLKIRDEAETGDEKATGGSEVSRWG